MSNLYIRITRPEGYEDVHHDLILQDMGINPVWGAEVVDVEAVLRECRGVLSFINRLDDDRDFLDQPEYEQIHKAIDKIDEVLNAGN